MSSDEQLPPTQSAFGVGAQKRLALPDKPEVQVAFRLKSDPNLSRDGSRVKADYGQPGGGREYATFEPVKVEVVNVQKY